MYTHHPADGATDSIGLKLTVEAPGHLVHLWEAEQPIKNKTQSLMVPELWGEHVSG